MEVDDIDVDSTEMHEDAISTVHRCQLADVKKLCLFDLQRKLKTPNEYDIGGCYSPDLSPEFWFYLKTSMCPGHNYLLSIYVCHRKAGNFTINISEGNQIKRCQIINQPQTYATLVSKLKSYTFVSGAPNECHYIKTFCFSDKELQLLGKCIVFIPIDIITDTNEIVDPTYVQHIKLAHGFGHLLGSKKWSDLVLESASGQKYNAHKIILSIQSLVLKEMIRDFPNGTVMKLDIDDSEMELLLQFIYTGRVAIKSTSDSFKLLELASQFDLNGLSAIGEDVLGENIDVNNAVSIAVISEKYKLEVLQTRVFDFMAVNPEVQETEAWLDLQDVQLTKKFLQHIYRLHPKNRSLQ